jgi:hypothetical protein
MIKKLLPTYLCIIIILYIGTCEDYIVRIRHIFLSHWARLEWNPGCHDLWILKIHVYYVDILVLLLQSTIPSVGIDHFYNCNIGF